MIGKLFLILIAIFIAITIGGAMLLGFLRRLFMGAQSKQKNRTRSPLQNEEKSDILYRSQQITVLKGEAPEPRP
jgi:flagellar basal body-associated protein FliL